MNQLFVGWDSAHRDVGRTERVNSMTHPVHEWCAVDQLQASLERLDKHLQPLPRRITTAAGACVNPAAALHPQHSRPSAAEIPQARSSQASSKGAKPEWAQYTWVTHCLSNERSAQAVNAPAAKVSLR
jgi:hypothetical protein